MDNIIQGIISKGYLHNFQQDKQWLLSNMRLEHKLAKLTIWGRFPNINYFLTVGAL
jgi:hypothetical protein